VRFSFRFFCLPYTIPLLFLIGRTFFFLVTAGPGNLSLLTDPFIVLSIPFSFQSLFSPMIFLSKGLCTVLILFVDCLFSSHLSFLSPTLLPLFLPPRLFFYTHIFSSPLGKVKMGIFPRFFFFLGSFFGFFSLSLSCFCGTHFFTRLEPNPFLRSEKGITFLF